jgi:hypothetical protein
MRSVADELKEEERRVIAAMTPEERLALAFDLGTRDLETFRLAHDPVLDADTADRLLRRQRQAGRRRSRCLEELIG